MKKRIAQGFLSYLRTKNIFINVIVLLLYVIFGKIGLSFAFVNPSATAIWAPTGIALAALIVFGYRVFPAIFLGAFIVNLSTSGGILTSLGIAMGNTAEGIVGAYLIKRFANGLQVFDRVLGIFTFTLLAGILSTMVSATIGVTTLVLGGLTTLHDFWPVWLTWWMGDMGGNLLVAPLLIVWAGHLKIHFTPRGILHFLSSIIAIGILSELVFGGVLPYPYLCIPLVVWVAFWFGRRGATVTTFFVAIIAIVDTLHGKGPFVDSFSLNHSLILLQTFLGILSLTGLTFATTLLEFRKSKKIIASQEQRFKALIENSFDAVVLIDVASKILYASPSVQRLLGYTPEELKGKVGFDLVIPEDRAGTMKTLAELVVKPGGTTTVEYRTVRKDAKIIWVEATGTNLLFEPSINAVVVNFHDITDKKIAEAQMLKEKMVDEAMLGSIGDGIIATDNEGIITMVNQRGCELLGEKEKDLLGKSIITAITLVDEDDHELPIEERPMTKVLHFGKKIVTSSAVYYLRKDKRKFPVHFTITPILLDKKVVGTIEVFQDITQEKEVDKAKTEFVSLASHQLRTPLATINWYLEELINNGANLTEKQHSYLVEVYSASKRMVDLINALLNTSRLELGTFIIEPAPTNIVQVAKQVVQDALPRIKEKELILKEDYQENIPPMQADAKLLAIIIQNFLSNAIKYTKEKGSLGISINYTGKEFVIRVKDTGFGIPRKQQSKIFSKLFRADNARTLEPEGSGLGLYIVKSIVTVSGGKISFESEENKGTTFSVSFPSAGMQQKTGKKQLM